MIIKQDSTKDKTPMKGLCNILWWVYISTITLRDWPPHFLYSASSCHSFWQVWLMGLLICHIHQNYSIDVCLHTFCIFVHEASRCKGIPEEQCSFDMFCSWWFWWWNSLRVSLSNVQHTKENKSVKEFRFLIRFGCHKVLSIVCFLWDFHSGRIDGFIENAC